jgi:hypothetical protein
MRNSSRLYMALALAAAGAAALLARRSSERKSAVRPLRDYSNRSGFPRPASEMRGLAAPKQPRAVPPM